MRTFLVAALLLVASLALVPSASASDSCDGVVPGAFCVVGTAETYCTNPPVILSQCYGYTIIAARDYAVGNAIAACELVLGPGNCNLA